LRKAILLLLFLLTARPAAALEWFTLETGPPDQYCGGFSSCQCWVTEDNTTVYVHVVHRFTGDTQMVRFRLVADPGLNWVHVRDSVCVFQDLVVSYTGDTQTGIEIDTTYEGEWAIVLAVVEYAVVGSPDPCARLRVGAHPDATTSTVECQAANEEWRNPPIVHSLPIQGPNYCYEPQDYWCILQPVETTTWGAIKALYGD
jgi:hypothetical protein